MTFRQVPTGDTIVLSGEGRVGPEGRRLATTYSIPGELGPRLELVVHFRPAETEETK